MERIPPTHSTDMEAEYAEHEKSEVVLTIEKSEQAIRIFEKLWERRAECLEQYIQDPENSEQQLNKLNEVNQKERHVVSLISGALRDAEHQLLDMESWLSQSNEPEIAEFQNKVSKFTTLISTYKNLLQQHRSLLDFESDFISDPDPQRIKLYVKKFDAFQAEFETNSFSAIEDLNSYFSSQRRAVDEAVASNEVAKKPWKDVLTTSFVNTMFRMCIGNAATVAVTASNPFENPQFVKLNIALAATSTAISYTDYYYGFFSKLTGKISALLTNKKTA